MGLDFDPFDSIEQLTLQAGEYLFEQGEPSEQFHLLLDGSLELTRNQQTFREIDEENTPIGNLDLTMDNGRTFGARATEPTRVMYANADPKNLQEWYRSHPSKHIEELTILSSVLDVVNRENKHLFEKFRDYRDLFSPFLTPLRHVLDHYEEIELSPLLDELLTDYLEIIDQAGKSGTISIDGSSIPDDVTETFSPGDHICTAGEKEDDLYLLIEGSLTVLKDGQMVSSIEKPGLLFGEMSAFLDQERKATVTAETESTVAVLPGDTLPSLFENSPKTAKKISRMLVRRLEKANTLNHELKRFHRNLKKLFGTKKQFKTEQSTVEKLVSALKGKESNNQEMENRLEELEEWANEKYDEDELFQLGLKNEKVEKFKTDV